MKAVTYQGHKNMEVREVHDPITEPYIIYEYTMIANFR